MFTLASNIHMCCMRLNRQRNKMAVGWILKFMFVLFFTPVPTCEIRLSQVKWALAQTQEKRKYFFFLSLRLCLCVIHGNWLRQPGRMLGELTLDIQTACALPSNSPVSLGKNLDRKDIESRDKSGLNGLFWTDWLFISELRDQHRHSPDWISYIYYQ